LGLPHKLAMRKVILPQAFVRMIPALGNEFIALIKNSALVSLLTIADVMHEGEKIISVSYRSLEVYLAIAFIYLMLTSITTLILRRTEKVLRADGRV
jgi:polar amino acid transport system permease protein